MIPTIVFLGYGLGFFVAAWFLVGLDDDRKYVTAEDKRFTFFASLFWPITLLCVAIYALRNAIRWAKPSERMYDAIRAARARRKRDREEATV